MSWIVQFFNSSIGNKLLMSLTGLFLCSFLLVHCAGNCLLFANDNGVLFNHYAEFMSKNPVIKFVAYGLYFAILLHALKGIAIWWHNRSSRGGQNYSQANSKGTWPFWVRGFSFSSVCTCTTSGGKCKWAPCRTPLTA